MQLKVLIEATGKSWTLKPGREYLMGTSPDCDIMVESIDDSIGESQAIREFKAWIATTEH